MLLLFPNSWVALDNMQTHTSIGENPVSGGVTSAARGAEMEADVQRKIKMWGVIEAFRDGRLPGNDQIDHALKYAQNHSPVPTEKLSPEGKELVDDVREIIGTMRDMVREKNGDELIQKTLWQSWGMDLSHAKQGGVTPISSAGAKQDADVAGKHLRVLATLFLTNGEVRKLVSDLGLIGRDMFATAAVKAADAARPDEQRLNQVDQPAPDKTWIGADGQRLGPNDTPELQMKAADGSQIRYNPKDNPRDAQMIDADGNKKSAGEAYDQYQDTKQQVRDTATQAGQQGLQGARDTHQQGGGLGQAVQEAGNRAASGTGNNQQGGGHGGALSAAAGALAGAAGGQAAHQHGQSSGLGQTGQHSSGLGQQSSLGQTGQHGHSSLVSEQRAPDSNLQRSDIGAGTHQQQQYQSGHANPTGQAGQQFFPGQEEFIPGQTGSHSGLGHTGTGAGLGAAAGAGAGALAGHHQGQSQLGSTGSGLTGQQSTGGLTGQHSAGLTGQSGLNQHSTLGQTGQFDQPGHSGQYNQYSHTSAGAPTTHTGTGAGLGAATGAGAGALAGHHHDQSLGQQSHLGQTGNLGQQSTLGQTGQHSNLGQTGSTLGQQSTLGDDQNRGLGQTGQTSSSHGYGATGAGALAGGALGAGAHSAYQGHQQQQNQQQYQQGQQQGQQVAQQAQHHAQSVDQYRDPNAPIGTQAQQLKQGLKEHANNDPQAQQAHNQAYGAYENVKNKIPEQHRERLAAGVDTTKEIVHDAFPPERREQFIFRLKKVLVEVQQHKDYYEAMSWLLDAFERYQGYGEHVANKGQQATQQAAGDKQAATAVSNFFTVLERFANGRSLGPVRRCVDQLYKDAANDPELRRWWQQTDEYIHAILLEPGYVMEDSSTEEGNQIVERGKAFFTQRYKNEWDQLWTESVHWLKAFNEDPLNRRFGEDWKRLTKDLLFNEEGNLSVKPKLWNDIRHVILPSLIQHIGYIPIPRAEYVEDGKLELVIENLILSGPNLFPNIIEVENHNYLKFSPYDNIRDRSHHRFRVALAQIHADIRDVRFAFRKKGGFPRISDSGIADVVIARQGISVDIELETVENRSNSVFRVRSVDTKIDQLSFKIRDSKHDLLYKFIKTAATNTIKRAISSAVESAIRGGLDYIDEQLAEVRNTVNEAKESDETTRKEALQALYKRKKAEAEEAKAKADEKPGEFKIITDRDQSMLPNMTQSEEGSIAERIWKTEDAARSGSDWHSPAFAITGDQRHPAVTGHHHPQATPGAAQGKSLSANLGQAQEQKTQEMRDSARDTARKAENVGDRAANY